MYLKIGETQYTCTNRIKSASGTLKFLGVSPAPGEVSGTIQMYRDDGSGTNYLYAIYSDGMAVITSTEERNVIYAVYGIK